MSDLTLTRKPHTNMFLSKLIKTNHVKEVHDAIKNCHKTSGNNPKSMLLTGLSGAGKSTSISLYLRGFEVTETADRNRIPVLYCSLKPRCTVKTMLSVLLKACGCGAATQGTEIALFNRLCNYIDKLGVELIIIDEIHHVLPEHTHRRTQEAADLLKSLVDETRVPLILVGLPHSTRLLTDVRKGDTSEDQLRRRFRKTVQINVAQYGTLGWENLMKAYQQLIGVPCINLTSSEMMLRMFIATEGLPGRISNLFEETLELLSDDEQIKLATLAKGFAESSSVLDLPENPFTMTKAKAERYLTENMGAVS